MDIIQHGRRPEWEWHVIRQIEDALERIASDDKTNWTLVEDHLRSALYAVEAKDKWSVMGALERLGGDAA